MAGIPSHPKGNSSKRGAGSTREKAKNPHAGQRKSSGSSSGYQQGEESSDFSNSPETGCSVELGGSHLFITTGEPSSFKKAHVQRSISQHVMKDYTTKQQKESSRGKSKETPKPQGHKETVANSTSFPSSHTSTRPSSGYISGGPNMSTSSALDGSVLTQNMIYPLNIDLRSLDFQQRLDGLLTNYMREWFGAQAARLCGGVSHDVWKQWMPDEVENETLLYAQAFAAVTHINFLNPQDYQSERWNLKAQAIQAIKKTLCDQQTPHVDGNIGAVLCMAVIAPLDVEPYTNFVTHRNGLQQMVSIRGGLPAFLRSNRMLHDALCLCDLSGAFIFRTNLALVNLHELEQGRITNDLFNSPLDCCDPQRRSNPYSDIWDCLYVLTRRWHAANHARTDLKDSAVANECASIEHRLNLAPSHSAVPPHQVREACRLAGLIYFRALFHGIPFSSPENKIIMQGLRMAMENSIISGWNGSPGLLLWALLVGTAASRSQSEGTFFAGHLSTTCFCLVANWQDVQHILITVLHMERRVEFRAAER